MISKLNAVIHFVKSTLIVCGIIIVIRIGSTVGIGVLFSSSAGQTMIRAPIVLNILNAYPNLLWLGFTLIGIGLSCLVLFNLCRWRNISALECVLGYLTANCFIYAKVFPVELNLVYIRLMCLFSAIPILYICDVAQKKRRKEIADYKNESVMET